MKTRIISGIVMGAIVAAVLVVGFVCSSYVITIAIALLAVGAIYELLRNASGIKSKLAYIGACIYSFLMVLALDTEVYEAWFQRMPFARVGSKYISLSSCRIITQGELAIALSAIYFIYAVFMVLKNHKDFDLAKIVSLCALPLPYAYAFSCLNGIISNTGGIYYLLLLLNFSSICDMGAYFVGVTIGKHKLCPEISPKKTVEGAIGGIVSSIIFTVVISLLFKKFSIVILLLTIPFCILGMIGDLFASAIKRSVGLKDYSNLIPGHGGIMDRLDSIIMIAPFMMISMLWGII